MSLPYTHSLPDYDMELCSFVEYQVAVDLLYKQGSDSSLCHGYCHFLYGELATLMALVYTRSAVHTEISCRILRPLSVISN